MSKNVGHGGWRHWLGFIGSGGLSFVIDSGIMEALVSFWNWRAQSARLISIPCAIFVGWLSHRRFTFAVAAPPSFAEFAKFVAAASTGLVINYAVFCALLAAWPVLDKLVDLVIATAISMVATYLGFRFGAFRRPAG